MIVLFAASMSKMARRRWKPVAQEVAVHLRVLVWSFRIYPKEEKASFTEAIAILRCHLSQCHGTAPLPVKGTF